MFAANMMARKYVQTRLKRVKTKHDWGLQSIAEHHISKLALHTPFQKSLRSYFRSVHPEHQSKAIFFITSYN